MKKAKIAIVLLLGIMLVSVLGCGQKEWQLSTSVVGQGSISPNEGTYSDSVELTLTASPASGWSFDHWGGHCSGSQNPVTITMDSDKTVYAYFTQPTPTPTVLFSDDFSDPSSGWSTFSDSDGSAFYQGGWLHVKNNKYSEVSTYSYANQYFTDFIVEVEMKLVDGADVNWQTVTCRMDDWGNGYSFGIGADGMYIAAKIVDYLPSTYFRDPTSSIHVLKGKGVTNLVHIECIGSTLSFSVNGHLLGQFTDYTYTGGDILLGADSASWSAFTEVAFDNIVVTAP